MKVSCADTMADIMGTLILPKNASQDSFHSTHSQSSHFLPNPGPTTVNALILQDVDAFLDDCQNEALAKSRASFEATAGSKPTPHVEPQQPVLIGQTRSSQHIQTLHYLCQQRGIIPEFDLNGGTSTDWGGWLRINEHNIGSDQRWPTKKAAREGLAEKAIEIVKDIQIMGAQVRTSSQINWVGRLLGMLQPHGTVDHGVLNTTEYHNVRSQPEKPVYNDYVVGSLFACECSVPGRTRPYGGKENGFPNKKAARSNAAKEAVEHLIAQGLLNNDGTLKAKKKMQAGAAVKVEGKALNVEKSATYSQKVTGKCLLQSNVRVSYFFMQISVQFLVLPPLPITSAPLQLILQICSRVLLPSRARPTSHPKLVRYATSSERRMQRKNVLGRYGRSSRFWRGQGVSKWRIQKRNRNPLMIMI